MPRAQSKESCFHGQERGLATPPLFCVNVILYFQSRFVL
jgi:hypothetical protein